MVFGALRLLGCGWVWYGFVVLGVWVIRGVGWFISVGRHLGGVIVLSSLC